MVFPCSAADLAVPREPLLSAASATTTPKLNALTMRLRRGKLCCKGGVCGKNH